MSIERDYDTLVDVFEQVYARSRDVRCALKAVFATDAVMQKKAENTRPVSEATKAIVSRVAIIHGIKVHYLTGPSIVPAVVRVREEAMWLLRQSGLSLSDVGMALNKDHSSVKDALRRFEARMAKDEVLAARMRGIAMAQRAA